MIRSYVVGWPGSDSTVFNDSAIYRHPEDHFREDVIEYFIADAGYASEKWLCTPYRPPTAAIEYNKIFNELFSSACGVIPLYKPKIQAH
jgi:hypothetical protein